MDAYGNVQDQIRSGYARGARWHDAFVRTVSFGLEPGLRRRMLRRLGLHAGDAVPDLACGTGLNFEAIEAAIGPGGTLVGVDLSTAMLDEARKKVAAAGWANVTLLEADVAEVRRDPRIRVRPAHAALCTLAIGLMPDPEAVLRAMVAAVRPWGRVLISDVRLAHRWYGPVINPLLYEEWLGGIVYVAWGRRAGDAAGMDGGQRSAAAKRARRRAARPRPSGAGDGGLPTTPPARPAPARLSGDRGRGVP